jgi:hypothetical protein
MYDLSYKIGFKRFLKNKVAIGRYFIVFYKAQNSISSFDGDISLMVSGLNPFLNKKKVIKQIKLNKNL